MATPTKNAAPRGRSSTSSRATGRGLPLAQLDAWLGCLNGWAEVDSTCQTVFNDKDLLADWEGWSALLESLACDENINKRRAALVLLTAPITQSPDARILDLSFQLIDRLKGEKEGRITKAVSWLLRKGIKQHRDAIAAYVEANAGVPARHRRPRNPPEAELQARNSSIAHHIGVIVFNQVMCVARRPRHVFRLRRHVRQLHRTRDHILVRESRPGCRG